MLSVDVKRVDGVFVSSRGLENTVEAIDWIRRCVDDGAGEGYNSIDTDGVKGGLTPLLKKVCEAVKVPSSLPVAQDRSNIYRIFEAIPAVDVACCLHLPLRRGEDPIW